MKNQDLAQEKSTQYVWFTMTFYNEGNKANRSNALNFLRAVLPEEPRLLQRSGDEGGDCQRGRERRRGEDHVRMQYAFLVLSFQI